MAFSKMSPVSVKLSPRKKFSVNSEISNVVNNFKKTTNDQGWILKPSKKLIQRILKDLASKKIMSNGTAYQNFPWTRHEFINHIINNFEPKESMAPGAKSLSSRPYFYMETDILYGQIRPGFLLSDKPMDKPSTLKAYLKAIEDMEYDIKMNENWHAGSISFNLGEKDEELKCTYESIIDDYWCLLCEHSNQTAWKYLCQLLLSDKYKGISDFYIYLTLISILVRGVAKYNPVRDAKEDSDSVSSTLTIQSVVAGDVFDKPFTYTDMAYYYRTFVIEKELKLARFPCGGKTRSLHGQTWLTPDYIHLLTFKKVWNRIKESNRYRLENGYPPIFKEIFPTGLFDSVGESFGQGFAQGVVDNIVDNPKTDAITEKVLDTVAEASEILVDKIKDAGENVTEALEEKSRNFISDFAKHARDLTQDSAKTLANSAREILGGLPSSVELIGTFFGKSQEMISTVKNSFSKIFGSFLPENFKVTDDTIDLAIDLVKYWVMYNSIKEDCTIVKGALIVAICVKLGIFGIAKDWFDSIVSYLLQEEQIVPTADDGGWLSFVTSSPVLIVKAFSGFIATILSGRILSKIELGKLLHSMSGHFRDLAFLERGMSAIPKLFETFKGIFSSISSWISANIFGAIPEKKKVAAEIAQWTVSVAYFSTEEGRDMIRANIDAKTYASGLYKKGIALRHIVSSIGKHPDRDLHLEITRLWRDAKAVADFVTRLDAMSNFVPTMFHIQLVGEPGIGKSHLMKDLAWTLNVESFGEKYKNSVYSYNSDCDHFDGYAGQKTMYIDDVWRYNEPKHMSKLISLITNTPIMLPMAHLEEKGTQLTSEILLTTTNLAYPVPKDIFSIEAIYRRRHVLVNVTMDPRVRDAATKAFSPQLFKKYYPHQNMGDYPHLKFSLLKPVPTSLSEFEYEDESKESIEALKGYLKEVNENIIRPDHKEGRLHPDVQFLEEGEVQAGIQFPCKDWEYGKFITNLVARFRRFQEHENALSLTERYQRKFNYFTQIRAAYHKEMNIPVPDELTDGYVLDMNHSKVDNTIFKIMQDFELMDFTEVPKPTELEQRIHENADPIPELSDIKFGDIVLEEILKESKEDIKPTSDFAGEGASDWSQEKREEFHEKKQRWFTKDAHHERERLSLEQEAKRTARILEKKNKKIVKEEDPVESRCKSTPNGILIDSLMTMWDVIGEGQALAQQDRLAGIAYWFKQIQIEDLFEEFEYRHDFDPSSRHLYDALTKMMRIHMHQSGSRMMPIPSRKPFPEHLWKKSSGLSTYFLQRTFFIDGQFYFKPDLKMSDIKFQLTGSPLNPGKMTLPDYVAVSYNKKYYKVPFDLGFIYSMNGEFVNYVIELQQYTPSQIRELCEEARWRNSFTNFYTVAAIKQFTIEYFSKHCSKAYDLIMSPLRNFWSKMQRLPWMKALIGCMIGVGIYSLGRALAKLFMPNTEPTSKFMHRGAQSRIVIRPTSLSTERSAAGQAISSILRRNLRKIHIQGCTSQNETRQQVLCSGQFVFLNKHAFLKFDKDEEFIIEFFHPGKKNEFQYIISRKDIVMLEGTDLAAIHSQNIPAARAIDHLLLTDREFKEAEFAKGLSILSADEEAFVVSDHTYLEQKWKLSHEFMGKKIELDHTLMVVGEGIAGYSGSPVITNAAIGGSMKIVGIQAWSINTWNDRKIAIQVITKERFDKLKQDLAIQKNQVLIEREADFEDSIVEIQPCSAFKSQNDNNIITELPKEASVGTVGKTAFERTPLAPFMDKAGYQSKRVPACLSPFDPHLTNGDKIHPLSNSLGKYFKGSIKPFDPKRLQYIEDSLVGWFKTELDTTNFRVLSLEEAITGTREDGSNPMDLTTSPGLPFVKEDRKQKGKKDYFEIGEDGEVSYISDEIRQEYEEFKEKVCSGILPLTLSYDFPKDELRPKEKAYGTETEPPKTRSVTCMNMFYVILWRQLTLDLWAAFHRRADGTFPFCPGINPDGPEWSNAFHFLNKFGLNAVDFDVSNWDGFARAELVFMAARILARLLGFAPNSPEEIALRVIVTEVMFGYIQHGTIIYQKFRGIISGFPGTAEINTLIHLILLIYFYLELAAPYGLDYFQAILNYLRYLIYGDDIIITIADEVLHFFNGETIAKAYRDLGYPVTSATKSQEILKSKPLLECSFLKSTWHHLFEGIWIRKMDLDVAYDLLYWVRAKEHPIAQFQSNA
ncbi:non-structural polyprotein [Solenopsis invicta virus 8]|nr:non-structural polyprotein [Solenopsis invicta virus 8]